MSLRPDLAVIADNVPEGSSVFDIGCGDGALMAELVSRRGVDARGLELDADNVAAAVAKGLSVVQGNADTDLDTYPAGSFDYAILSQTLQTTWRPDLILKDLMRLGSHAFVSFPNFAHWRIRTSLLLGGRMPVTRLLPARWYDTPNIHHLTIDDFRALVDDLGFRIEKSWFLSGGHRTGGRLANLMAEHAVFLLGR
ncbi:methionine biosynthesis protein MetW [Pacificimonas flava]|uniref:Methionine biosynthesis protein MetW n=2 Tax=Pacificimonas TaxID=1960290 RepID=A0A219B3F6_9SPHN|nr:MULTISPECIES: methionine biosynthesis protein MetW [Pacificimonas]MBZ6377480.1 methionine biosynthesis protein MetW [Pacificimonas aurantium]OWV32821.1 methionine biosynthesis protein MetW [Pacificimonas flava]